MLQKIPESIGHALHDQRAGLEHTVFERLGKSSNLALIEVSSSAFAVDNSVPIKYTADGGGVSPPLEWRNLPSGTSFVAVIVEDADSPTPHPLVHAIVVNLDPRESSLVEGALDSPDHSGIGLQTGPNSFLSHAWLPPDPPPGHGPHRYVFQVFALSGPLLEKAPGREELVRAITEFGIGAGRVIATYERAQRVKNEDRVTNEKWEPENPQSLGPDLAPA
jgi:Raf kinase inhibitor-like YbhB/YbcL family protein